MRFVLLGVLGVLLFSSLWAGPVRVEVVGSVCIEEPEDYSFGSISATETRYYQTDYKGGGFLSYGSDGKLLQKNIAKGVGPKEFLSPIWIDYAKSQLLIADTDRLAVHLLRLHGDRVAVHDIINLGYHPKSLCWAEGLFVVVGFWHDGERAWWARGFSSSNRAQKPIPLLTQEMVIGMSDEQSRSPARNGHEALAAGNLIAYGGGRIFGCWGGRLRVVSATLQGRDVAVLGDPGKYYDTPKATQQMIDAYERGDYKKLVSLNKGMCIIRGLAATQRYLYITFSTPKGSGGSPGVAMQIYRHGGQLIGETMISDLFEKRGIDDFFIPQAFENRKDHELYLSQYTEDGNGENAFYVHRISIK